MMEATVMMKATGVTLAWVTMNGVKMAGRSGVAVEDMTTMTINMWQWSVSKM